MKHLILESDKMFEGATIERDDSKKTYNIRGVALLGLKSKHGYDYLPEALKGAVGLYENAKAFINHPSSEEEKSKRRDVRNLAGKYTNVRFDESGQKLRGDFIGLPNENGKLFADIAETMPDMAALSHNASGNWGQQNGKKVVESISEVHSVDLVWAGATNEGMFESIDTNKKENHMEWKDIDLNGLKTNRKDLCEALSAEGAVSRDEEVNGLTVKLTEATKNLDTLKVKDALTEKKSKIDKVLSESKLPLEAKTEVFKNQLYTLEAKEGGKSIEEQSKELIEDRLLAISGKKGVVNMGGGKDMSGDKPVHIKECV